jgi:hypothetical protein
MNELQQLALRIAAEEGVDPQLALKVIEAESSWNPRAVSKAGAMGLMQLMPDTARGLGVTDPFDPEQNLRGGMRYLKEQIDEFGTVPLGLAAYNAGPGKVRKYGGIPPYSETQDYVRKITADQIAPGPAYQGGSIQPVSAQPQVQAQPQMAPQFQMPQPTLAQRMAANPYLQMGLGIMASPNNIGKGAILGLNSASNAQNSRDAYMLEVAKTLGKDNRTALEKQLIAAGLQPGTPGYQQAILQHLFTPRTVVNTGNPTKEYVPPGAVGPAIGGDPSKGYPFPDPTDPTGVRVIKPTGSTQATEGEVKSTGALASAKESINNIKRYVDSGAQIAGVVGYGNEFLSSPDFWGTAARGAAELLQATTGIDVAPDEKTLGALTETELLRTIIGQYVSGADVPEEQRQSFKMFMPSAGDSAEMIKIKLDRMSDYIDTLERAGQLRQRSTEPEVPVTPITDDELDEAFRLGKENG